MHIYIIFYHVLPLSKVSSKAIEGLRRSCPDKVPYRCNSSKTLKLNYLPFEAGNQNFIPLCTSTYHVLPLCKVSSKSIAGLRRSCADKVQNRCNSSKTLKLNYLPFEAMNQNFITLCTSTYHVLPLCKLSSKSIAGLRKSWADKV